MTHHTFALAVGATHRDPAFKLSIEKKGGMPKFQLKTAFTLAEVLITLAIIGAVAALTLPALITKYQQNVFATAFKKQYSVLNNAIGFITLEEGISKCYFEVMNGGYNAVDEECKILKQNLISKLNMKQIENDFTFTPRTQVLSEGGVSNIMYGEEPTNANAYMLPDGAVVFFRLDNYSYHFYNSYILLDTNGKKGPNRWGYDRFWLTFTNYKDKIRLTDEYSVQSEKGGSLPRNILINKWSNEYRNYGYGQWNL